LIAYKVHYICPNFGIKEKHDSSIFYSNFEVKVTKFLPPINPQCKFQIYKGIRTTVNNIKWKVYFFYLKKQAPVTNQQQIVSKSLSNHYFRLKFGKKNRGTFLLSKFQLMQ